MKCPYCIRICSKCGRLLVANLQNFSKMKNGKYGLRSECRNCGNKRNKQWYENNKEKRKEYKKQYYGCHKDEILEYSKQYYQKNSYVAFNSSIKRRNKKETQGSGINKDQWYEMMEFFDWKCAYSGVKLNKNNRSIDHIIPLSLNGEHEVWNCVPMEKTYNSSKHISEMISWYIQQDFFSEERLNKIYEWQKYAFEKYSNQ